MSINSHIIALQQLSIFRHFSSDSLEPLAARSSIKSFKKNTIVIMDDDDTKSVYFILQGSVRVFRENGLGKEVTLNELKEDDFFGELAWLSENCRTASVVTRQACKLLVIQARDFELFYSMHPEIARAIMFKLAKQVSNLSSHLEAVVLGDIHQRVIWALTNYAEKDQEDNYVSTATHRELANLIGSSRESVSRAIQDLKINGRIMLKNKAIYIQNISKEINF